MKRALTYLGWFSCSVLVVAIGFGWSLLQVAGPTKSSGTNGSRQVQERSVPRMVMSRPQFRQMQPPSRIEPGICSARKLDRRATGVYA